MKKTKIKKSKARRIIEWCLTIVFGAVFLVVAVATIEGMINKDKNCGQSLRFGFGTFIVQTDSMEDQYPKQSAIITHKDDVKDVYNAYLSLKENEFIDITFFDGAHCSYNDAKPSNPNFTITSQTTPTKMVMTHRLREMKFKDNNYIFIVSGTNTGGMLSKEGQWQSFTQSSYIGVVKSSSQFLGHVLGFVSSVWGLFILLLIPAFYLTIVSVLDIFKKIKDVPDTPNQIDTTSGEINEETKPSNPNVDLSTLSDKERERLKQELLEELLKGKK